MGRGKLYKPTDKERQQVFDMAGFGISQEDIAVVMGVSPPTLRKHFRAELDVAMTSKNVAVARNLFRIASTSDNPSAAMFWCKTRMGWRETEQTKQENIEVFVRKAEPKGHDPEAVEAEIAQWDS